MMSNRTETTIRTQIGVASVIGLKKAMVAAALALALAACGNSIGGYGTTSPPPPPPPNGTVDATPSLAFTPRQVTINAGDAVNFDFGSIAHNVIFDDRTAATPADIVGNNVNLTVSRTFTAAGTYNYHCNIHPGMAGVVVVRVNQ
jgi:plastocyanin